MTAGEALELCEQLVRRASALTTEENPLPIDKIEVADYIFQLCQYHHPENITLPPGYILFVFLINWDFRRVSCYSSVYINSILSY